MAFGVPTSLGKLRWHVELCSRKQIPDPNTTGIITLISPFAIVHADIEPVGAQSFLNGMQLEIGDGLTHRIFMRWRDFEDVDLFKCIIRRLNVPTGPRVELFHVIRAAEYNGRHRFLMVEVQMEKFVDTYQIAPYS
jgi:hypothetical protein